MLIRFSNTNITFGKWLKNIYLILFNLLLNSCLLIFFLTQDLSWKSELMMMELLKAIEYKYLLLEKNQSRNL